MIIRRDRGWVNVGAFPKTLFLVDDYQPTTATPPLPIQHLHRCAIYLCNRNFTLRAIHIEFAHSRCVFSCLHLAATTALCREGQASLASTHHACMPLGHDFAPSPPEGYVACYVMLETCRIAADPLCCV